MTRINSFENLECWRKSRELNFKIYKLTESKSNFISLQRQVRRSVISISSNIAEGYERNSHKEFRRFLRIAKGSAGELRSQLYLMNDLNIIDGDEFNQVKKEVLEISKMLGGLIKYLERKINNKT